MVEGSAARSMIAVSLYMNVALLYEINGQTAFPFLRMSVCPLWSAGRLSVVAAYALQQFVESADERTETDGGEILSESIGGSVLKVQ